MPPAFLPSLISLLVHSCCSLSLSPDSPFCVSSLLITLSVLPSLLAVSRTQTRTLRCPLRYTGLASWPCSVHHSIPASRCTEPLRHQSLCALSPPAGLLAAPSVAHHHTTHQTDHSLLPDFTSQTAAVKPFQLIFKCYCL